MDLYSIQNSGGEVYGIFDMPGEDRLDPSEWEGRLTIELQDILGINGVRYDTFTYEGIDQERIVIDLKPYGTTMEDVDRVHMVVGSICLSGAAK